MKYDFNGTEIDLKDRACKLVGCVQCNIHPQINLYIKITNKCNARCKFCTYHGKDREFDYSKFERALSEVKNRDILNKIQITGGEPSLDEDKLQRVVNIIRKYFPNTFISINSNGTDLLSLISVKDQVDNFAISRHHYDDNKNRQIFDANTVPIDSQIKVFIEVVGANKVHLSCNLLKSGIGTSTEMKRYLDFCARIGCEDVGFVTLMDTNKFCTDERVLFEDTEIGSDIGILKHKEFTKDGDVCRCANYLYHSRENNKLIEFYARFVTKRDVSPGILVFDIDKFRYGFSGPEIHI